MSWKQSWNMVGRKTVVGTPRERMCCSIFHLLSKCGTPLEAPGDFASYFSIVDWAVLRLWWSLGRTVGDFLRRRVLDRQLCFLANADADDVLDIEVTTHRDAEGTDVVDTTLRHQDGSLLAVARQQIA